MDDREYFSETLTVHVHGEQTIEATYTNDPAEVQRVLDMYKLWIAEGEEKLMGLCCYENASHEHVLVYPRCRGRYSATRPAGDRICSAIRRTAGVTSQN